jgi:hypothetical protein
MYIHTHICIYTYIHTHTYVYTHIYTSGKLLCMNPLRMLVNIRHIDGSVRLVSQTMWK